MFYATLAPHAIVETSFERYLHIAGIHSAYDRLADALNNLKTTVLCNDNEDTFTMGLDTHDQSPPMHEVHLIEAIEQYMLAVKCHQDTQPQEQLKVALNAI